MCYVCLGCTKTRSPEIGKVLHWRPPDVDIFHTDPSLVGTEPLVEEITGNYNELPPRRYFARHW